MTDIERAQLSHDDARLLVDSIRVDVADIGERIVAAYLGQAWIALGYVSWDALCDIEFEGAQLRVPREDRVEQVQSLRSAGLSTRAIGAALGVTQGTVMNDLRTSPEQNYSVDAPKTVRSINGKTYPATQPARAKPAGPDPATVKQALASYPELNFYAETRPDQVVTLAAALDAYPETERAERRDNLNKSIAYERTKPPVKVEAVPESVWHSDIMFKAAVEFAMVVKAHGRAANVEAACLHMDSLTIGCWRGQWQDVAALATDLVNAIPTSLRRIQ